ncbi:GNAT family N-acetyltransferase [Corallococcus sp. BB11-1]|uniref:GNAT family N-acetyltransferase n=1 Tax=Corallococcus sp. BB11-1 TaxID=2996783 RepID=UPI00226FA327|nr:GNAT family N-acetyltransferase [Corallococcus sp. BB11-1]MCY1035343.1 GNAT family N-acetyltransferase [Corallococcus sp. BB11-1]
MFDILPVQTTAERGRYVAVRNQIHPDTPISLEEHFSDSRQDDRIDLLAVRDGIPVGTATARRYHDNRDAQVAFVSVRVLRPHRRHGVGSALFAAVSEHAARIGRTGLYTLVRRDDADSQAFLFKRGFDEALRVEEVALVLEQARVEASVPQGVRLVPLTPALDAVVHPVATAIDPDIPSAEPVAALPLDAWRRRMFGPGARRDLSFVAFAGEEVVGYALLSESGPGVAEHLITGVRRDWRRRGVGQALKAAQLRGAQAAGFRELHAEVESENAAMRRLYARLGYTPRLTWLHLRGPLVRARGDARP